MPHQEAKKPDNKGIKGIRYDLDLYRLIVSHQELSRKYIKERGIYARVEHDRLIF